MTINALSIIPCKTDGCPTMGDYAIKKKMNVKWGKHKVGDIVLFDFNNNGTSDHIGIVIGINGSKITTIEGNTGSGNNTNGGQVQIRTRTKGQVNYFVRPKYSKTVTADMVIATAKAEVGVKESPKNSNKVKYNQWFYGKNQSAYWCCTFVCWVFAHVKGEEVIPTVAKPTGKYAGTIPSGLLKKGSKGDKVGQLQKFLNWYHPAWNLRVDKDFGSKTESAVKSFQKTEGIKPDGEFGSVSYGKAKAYKASNPPSSGVTKPTTQSTQAQKAVEWGREIAKSGKYSYKKWNDKDKKTKQCPICHKLTGKYRGWNCIGFVSACFYHGAGNKNVTCSCNGIGTNSFFTKVTESSWAKRNGKGWKMITNGGSKGGSDISTSKLIAGDVLICYDGNGKFKHIALYAGNGYILESTKTRKPNVGQRTYKDLCGRHHVTRAFRYVG